jgi:hypothetical protein
MMGSQLTLFCDTKRERFEKFHAENPHVYRALARHARRLKANGVTHFGIDGLFSIVRYTEALRTRDADGFVLNNNLKPLFARLIEKQEPDLRGFLSTRALKSE